MKSKIAQSIIEYVIMTVVLAIIGMITYMQAGKFTTDAALEAGSMIDNDVSDPGQAYCQDLGGTWSSGTQSCKLP